MNNIINKIKEINKLKGLKRTKSSSIKDTFLFSSKTLSKDEMNKETKIILLEITNCLTKKLVLNKSKTNCIRIFISYQNEDIPSFKMTLNLSEATDNYSKIIKPIIINYNKNIIKDDRIKKIGISFAIL